MSSNQVRTVVNTPVTTPQVIIITENKESLVSSGIGSLFGRPVAIIGAAGFISGGFVGVFQNHTYPLISAMVAGAIATTAATLCVQTLQVTADLGVNTTLFALKLPFKLVFAVINGTQSLLKGGAKEDVLTSAPLSNNNKV